MNWQAPPDHSTAVGIIKGTMKQSSSSQKGVASMLKKRCQQKSLNYVHAFIFVIRGAAAPVRQWSRV